MYEACSILPFDVCRDGDLPALFNCTTPTPNRTNNSSVDAIVPSNLFTLPQDIDEVICEGTSVTIIYSKTTVTGAPAPARRRSLSPFRRSSVSSPAGHEGAVGGGQASKLGLDRRRKVYSTSQERDAQILHELLLFVRRKAISDFAAAVSRLAAAANSPAASVTSVDSATSFVVDSGGNKTLTDSAIFGSEPGREGRESTGDNTTSSTGVFTKRKGRRSSVK